MFKNKKPSEFLRPLVPAFLHEKWESQLDQGFVAIDAVLTGQDERAQSLRMALIAFCIRIVSALIAFLSQVLMARWLGSNEYGAFVWVWVAAVILGNLSCLGFPSASVKFIPQYRVKGDEDSLRGIIFGARGFVVTSSTIIALLGVLAALALGELIPAIYSVPVLLATFCLPMLALGDSQNGIARAFNWSDLAFSPTYIYRPVLILVFMIAALQMGMEASATTAVIASIAATWLTTMIQLLLMNRRVRREVNPGSRKISLRSWTVVAVPIFLVEASYVLFTSVDIMLVGIYLPPKDVGIYFAAAKTLALVHFVYFAIRAGVAHRYSQYYSAGANEQFESFVHDSTKWTFWPSLLMAALVLMSGHLLLSMFGSEFVDGYPLMFILVLGILARASIGPAESVLTMSGNQNVCALVYGLTLFLNILLNIMLIPKFGLYGAAVATTLAMGFEAGALYSLTLRRLGIHMFVLAKPPSLSSATARVEV
ncbi:MAG: lipopolysaccharide biosynthesis protein [Rhizobiaceae bacterium]